MRFITNQFFNPWTRLSESKTLDRLIEQENTWSAFQLARKLHAKDPSPRIASVLEDLIGTTTPYGEIQTAVAESFDAGFYLKSNPDVARATDDALTHYLLHGWKEGRNPNLFFDHGFYGKAFKLNPKVFPLAHYYKVGRATGIPPNGVSERFWLEPTAPEEAAWASAPSAMRDQATECVVIMPVYKGYDETLLAIYAALRARGSALYSLLVINDRSPDLKLSEKLKALSEQGLFEYHVNEANIGFVRTVNLGLEELSGALDVVLLNSDAFVYPGWYERLVAHAKRDHKVATVTPFSNNATICSYPRFNQDNHAALELSPEALDVMAAKANRGQSVEVPTGVGFCMYMRRSVIDDIGVLDSQAFKVGYGEENDFCMRALEAGYKNLLAADVFVFHKGSVSFAASKDSNFDQGQKALLVKHPNYEVVVHAHLAADPARHQRRALDIARLKQAMRGAVIFVTHNWGGGIETYLRAEYLRLKAEGVPSFLLKVHDGHFATIETWPGDGPHVPNLQWVHLAVDIQLIEQLIADIAPSLLHVNSFARLDWAQHARMLDVIERAGAPFLVVGHDYAPICHVHNLLRPDSFYAGVPDIEERRRWARMNDTSGALDRCDPEERRERYTRFLVKSSRVLVPSEATQAIYAAEFPGIAIEIVPHEDHLPDLPRVERVKGRRDLVVALIGAIGPHKGSDVLVGLATHINAAKAPIKLHIVGHSNHDHRLKALGIEITGPYHDEIEASEHLDRIAPDLILIPSIWPETFCYTLSFAFKKGIPPVVFDLGAQAERVKAANFGTCLPLDLAFKSRALAEAIERLPVDHLWAAPKP